MSFKIMIGIIAMVWIMISGYLDYRHGLDPTWAKFFLLGGIGLFKDIINVSEDTDW